MAHCTIYGIFKEDSRQALTQAQSMGAWGGCSYSCEQSPNDIWEHTPEIEGDISFELFGRSPFDKLHKIARAVCKKGMDYRITISEWELPL